MWTEFALMLLVLANLRLLGGSRLLACISTAAFQGVVLGLLPLTVASWPLDPRIVLLSLLSLLIKGWGLPVLLRKALRETSVNREIQPIVSLNLSLLFGLAVLALSGWLGSRLPLPTSASALGAPVAFFTLFTGLFLVVARRQALTQVLGYLVLENGIFLFGVLFAHSTPWIVEVGVLLDLLVGVFVMGITLFHINRAFDAIDSDRLAQLHDLAVQRPSPTEPTE